MGNQPKYRRVDKFSGPISVVGQKHCAIEDIVWSRQLVFAAQKTDATDERELCARGVIRLQWADKAKIRIDMSLKAAKLMKY